MKIDKMPQITNEVTRAVPDFIMKMEKCGERILSEVIEQERVNYGIIAFPLQFPQKPASFKESTDTQAESFPFQVKFASTSHDFSVLIFKLIILFSHKRGLPAKKRSGGL